MRKVKADRRMPLLLPAAVLIVLLLIGSLRLIRPAERHADTQEGIGKLQEMESADVADVRKAVMAASGKFKYQSEDGELNTDNIEEQNYRERFSGTVILGDSISAALTEYGFLDSTNVVSQVGLGFNDIDYYLDTVISLQPEKLILYLGYNDIGASGGDGDNFRIPYNNVVKALKDGLPDTQIYLHAVFPVREGDSSEPENEEFIPLGNAIIEELAEENGVSFLDNEALVNREAYDEDGIHFIREWYPLWLDCLAEETGL